MNYNINNILLIEDNFVDVDLIGKALSEVSLHHSLKVIRNGLKAIDYLSGKHKEQLNGEGLSLIILDLDLPGKSGYEILKFLKSYEPLRRVPVVVLTAAESQAEMEMSYDLYANCFITKPMDSVEFINTIKVAINFWCNIVQLPSKTDYN